MREIAIPNTDLTVSALCLGAGELGTRVRGDDALRAIGAFFDTAHCYGFWAEGGLGASERDLGRCLRELGLTDRSVVATKVGHPDGGEAYRRPDRYLAPEVISSDVTDCLERLGFESLALCYLHRDDARVPVGEIVDALNHEVGRGRIRYLGASNWSVARLTEANDYAAAYGLQGFVISQVQWSLAIPGWEIGEDPTMRYVTPDDAAAYAALGVPIAAYSASAGGYFSGRGAGGSFDSPDNAARAARAREVAEKLGRTPTQVALAWLLGQEALTIPITGALAPDHIREAVGAVDIDLTPEQVRWLWEGAPTQGN